MRVGVDVSPLQQTRAGTARYLASLLEALGRLQGLEIEPFSFGGPGRVSAGLRDVAWYPVGLALRARSVDVLHCPTFRGPLRSRTPLVVTVHDLAVLRLPEAFRRWSRSYGRVVVPRVLRAARRVIAVSEFTAGEIVELIGTPRERIRVVPEAPSAAFVPDGEAAAGEYVLAVSTLEPRKNLVRLADAARRVGIELRVAGGEGWGGVRLSGDGVRPLGFVDDDELARLYRGALCVAYPSLYEGFGLPVLEAMACGAPVVTSRGGATEEVSDGAAVLVDPHDVESIAAGIEEAIARRDELAAAGREHAARFSWEAAGRATLDVYREAADG